MAINWTNFTSPFPAKSIVSKKYLMSNPCLATFAVIFILICSYTCSLLSYLAPIAISDSIIYPGFRFSMTLRTTRLPSEVVHFLDNVSRRSKILMTPPDENASWRRWWSSFEYLFNELVGTSVATFLAVRAWTSENRSIEKRHTCYLLIDQRRWYLG